MAKFILANFIVIVSKISFFDDILETINYINNVFQNIWKTLFHSQESDSIIQCVYLHNASFQCEDGTSFILPYSRFEQCTY